MIASIVGELGSWTWWIIGLVLLIFEIVLPGVFMLWFGIAAMIVGTISLMVGEASWWSWQIQIVAFAVLSLGSAIIGRKYWYNVHPDTDEPNLNARSDRMVGQTSVLIEAMKDGSGRIKLGDTTWRVEGPDLPAGSRVKVVDSQSSTLKVEAVEE